MKRTVRRHQLDEDLAGRFEKGKQLYPKVPPNARGVLWRNSRNGKYFIWLMREWQRAALEAKGLTFDEELDLAYDLIYFVEDWDRRKFPRDIYQLSLEQAREVFRSRKRARPVPLEGEGTKLILDTGDFALIRYETRRAACFYGRGTKWCISSKETNHWWWNYRIDEWRVYLILSKTLPSDHPFYKVALLLRWKTREPPVIEGDWRNAVNKMTSPDELALSGYTREDVERIRLEATRDFRELEPAKDIEVFRTFKALRVELRRAEGLTAAEFELVLERLRPMREQFAAEFAYAVSRIPMQPLLPAFGEMFKSPQFFVLADADYSIWKTVAPHKTAMLVLAQMQGVRPMRAQDEFFTFFFSRGAFAWGFRSIDTNPTGTLRLEETLPLFFDSVVNSRFRVAESDFPTDSVMFYLAARLQLHLFALHGYLYGKNRRMVSLVERFLTGERVQKRIAASLGLAKYQVQYLKRGLPLMERDEVEFLAPEQMSWFVYGGLEDVEDVVDFTPRMRLDAAWLRAHVPKPSED